MVYKYSQLIAFDGFTTQMTVDVSGNMLDARTAIWSFYALDATEILGAVSVISATQVQINLSPAPLLGNYRLVGLG